MNVPVFLTSLGAYVPKTEVTVEEAILAGRYDHKRAEADGFSSVRVENELGPPEMALRSAKLVLSDQDSDAINTVYLASIHRHGHKLLWPPASYLQNELSLNSRTRVFSLNQGCNGAFVCASIAIDMISAGLEGDHIIIGADRFSGSGFDRFNSDLGTLYGDAAFSARFSADKGKYRVVCMVLESEPGLEGLYRNSEFAEESDEDHNIKSAKRDWLDKHGREGLNDLFIPALERLRNRLLSEVDLLANPASYIIYPNVGAGISANLYTQVLSDLGKENLWKFGRSIGHTGTSDQFLGLWDLDNQDILKSGERVLLIGAGNGLGLAGLLIERT